MIKAYLYLPLLFLLPSFCLAQASTLELYPSFTEQNSYRISDIIEITGPDYHYNFIGMSCYHHEIEVAKIYYRYDDQSGFSNWKEFRLNHEQNFKDRFSYEAEPLPPNVKSLQFKIEANRAINLNLRLFFPNTRNTLNQSNNRLACDLAPYCERNCWCSSCPIDTSPEFTDPTHIIVHHSAGFNQSNDFPSVVEYYWDLHVNTNGWDDIGYNWLIDANGVIYEGRPDGYQGAHFSCINENTIGICMIGDFTSLLPTNLAIAALTSLIGYEATSHSIDVLDQSYHLTGALILENVSGHRDGNQSTNGCSTTACPGNTLYSYLNSIKNQVTDLDCYDVLSAAVKDELFRNVVFPNPFMEELNIDIKTSSDKDLFLMDLNGKYIKPLKNGSKNVLANLEKGLYYIVSGNRIIEEVVKL